MDKSFVVRFNSDDQGFFSRRCPECNAQFKIGGNVEEVYLNKDVVFCPCCGFKSDPMSFNTPEQDSVIDDKIDDLTEDIISDTLSEIKSTNIKINL